MINYTQYRLSDNDDDSWMLDKIRDIGLDNFTEQENKVKAALDNLRPGKYYDLTDLSEEKCEIFIKLACFYIRDHHPEVVFSDDYTRITKIKSLMGTV